MFSRQLGVFVSKAKVLNKSKTFSKIIINYKYFYRK